MPWLNFFAWFSAFVPFSYAYFHYRASGLPEGQQNLRLLVFVPWMLPACMLLGGALVLLHEGGVGGPSSEILAGFARRVLPY